MGARGWISVLLPVGLALAAESTSSLVHGSVHGVAAALGAAILLFVAIAAPVAHTLSSVLPAKLGRTPQPPDARSSAVIAAKLRAARAPSPISRQASEEESEERLLRALGYDATAIHGEEDAEGGLTEAEIAAFRQRNSGTSDSPPVRFKDRVPEPLSEIMTRWQQQTVGGHSGSPASGGSPISGSSPCVHGKLAAACGSPCTKGGGTPAGKRPKHPANGKGGAARRDKKPKGRFQHHAASSPLAAGA